MGLGRPKTGYLKQVISQQPKHGDTHKEGLPSTYNLNNRNDGRYETQVRLEMLACVFNRVPYPPPQVLSDTTNSPARTPRQLSPSKGKENRPAYSQPALRVKFHRPPSQALHKAREATELELRTQLAQQRREFEAQAREPKN